MFDLTDSQASRDDRSVREVHVSPVVGSRLTAAASQRLPETSHVSPSLASSGESQGPAYELKFLLNRDQAARLELEFSSWMTLDPHADPGLDRSYRTTSLYSDTPGRDVFHRRDEAHLTKFRVRRYGQSGQLFLEQKQKRGQQVCKTRQAIVLHDLALLEAGTVPADWAGAGYRQQLAKRNLQPVCAVSYLRRAYFTVLDEQRLRLTFDHSLEGALIDTWQFPALDHAHRMEGARPFAVGSVVCEFKFHGYLPAVFKRAIEQFQLQPGGFSKYRACLEAHGMNSRGSAPDA